MLNQFPVNSMYLIGGASAAAAESNRRIVTENPMGELGSFLERCFFCKKRIAVNAEVFMYGYENFYLLFFFFFPVWLPGKLLLVFVLCLGVKKIQITFFFFIIIV
jgi:hypothetical protein